MTDALASGDKCFRHCLEIQLRPGFGTEEHEPPDGSGYRRGLSGAQAAALQTPATDDCRSP